MKTPTIIAEIETDLQHTEATKPKLLLVFIALDLLCHFYHGSLSDKMHAKRFKKFVKTFARLSEKQAEALYQLRNSLTHFYGSFALSKANRQQKLNFTEVFAVYLMAKKNYFAYVHEYESAREKFQKMLSRFEKSESKNELL